MTPNNQKARFVLLAVAAVSSVAAASIGAARAQEGTPPPLTLAPVRPLTPGATRIDESAVKRVLHVHPEKGNDATADGAEAKPYNTFGRATTEALAIQATNTGVKVLLAPGIYREGKVGESYAMGRWTFSDTANAPLVIEGAGWDKKRPHNTGDVIICGSEDFSAASATRPGSWRKNPDGTWSKDWPYALSLPPRPTSYPKEWGIQDAFLRYEQAHLDGTTYYLVNPPGYQNTNGKIAGQTEGDQISEGHLRPDECSGWVVDAQVNADGEMIKPGTFTIRPPVTVPADFDLNKKMVEITTKRTLFQFNRSPGSADTKSPTNLVLRNLTFRHGNKYGVLIQQQNQMLVEDCRFVQMKGSGAVFTPIRNATFRRCDFSDNGDTGVNPHILTNVRFDYCTFNRSYRQGEVNGFMGYSVCGVKVMRSSQVTFYRCEARHNRSTGFWGDVSNSELEWVESVSEYNSSGGTFFEASTSEGNNFTRLEVPPTDTFENPLKGLDRRYTMRAVRSIFAHNRVSPDAASYRNGIGRGVFLAETENAYVEGCMIYDNDVQIGTYDNSRGELRNNNFSSNLVAALDEKQRLISVASGWDSQETLPVRTRGENPAEIARLKGSWYSLFDGMNGGMTNDNTYFAPAPVAFSSRSQRDGLDPARTKRPVPTPALDLAAWREAHQSNSNNVNPDRGVDSRSRLEVGRYDGRPLVVATWADRTAAKPALGAFTVHRVSPGGYQAALPVRYRLRWEGAGGPSEVTGTVTIPAGERSAPVSPKAVGKGRTGAVSLVILNDNRYVTAGSATYTAPGEGSSRP